MDVTVLHGQMHHGSTWHITQAVLARLPDARVTEFYLPQDGPGFCTGCAACVLRDEKTCKDATVLARLCEALDRADVLVFDSPCYVMGMTGQLKTFFDHMGFRYMVHRPASSMFRKVGLCISTAAGGGAKKTTKAMAENLFFWGVARVFRYSQNVAASSWAHVKPKQKQKIEKDAARLAARVLRTVGHAKPGLKTRAFFLLMRAMQKGDWNRADQSYWQSHGWLGRARPWKEPPARP